VEVIARMRQHAISQLPVVGKDGSLIGVVSEVDLLDRMLSSDHDRAQTISGMVNRLIATTTPDQPLDEVLPELVTSKVLVLTDGDRKPTGILTVIDALEYLASQEAA